MNTTKTTSPITIRRALTLWPEWIPAIVSYSKRIENRTWPPPKNMVGQWIALHGGGTIGGGGATPRAQEAAIDVVLHTAERALVPIRRADLSEAARKARRSIQVVAKLGAPVRSSPSPWFFGPYGWVFDEVRVLREPVNNVIGMQGLWTIPDPLRAKVEDAVNGTIPIGNVLTLALPRCALCDRAADKITMTEDVSTNSADFAVTCHGQIETIQIPRSYMYQRAVQPAVAFDGARP